VSTTIESVTSDSTRVGTNVFRCWRQAVLPDRSLVPLDVGADLREGVEDALTWLAIRASETAAALECDSSSATRGDAVLTRVTAEDFQAEVRETLRAGRRFVLEVAAADAGTFEFVVELAPPAKPTETQIRSPSASEPSTAMKEGTPMAQQGPDVSWSLRDLVEDIKEVRFALVATSDGKALTSYGADDPDDVDRFAAVVAGLQALATPVAEQFPKYAGKLRLAMIEVDGGHLFVVRAGVESYLGILAREGIDQGLLGHQMKHVAQSMRGLLGTAPRLEKRGEPLRGSRDAAHELPASVPNAATG